MTTQKQTDANRKNAALSTGPHTEEGKTVVSRNALKHGVFAREVVISAGDGRENEDEYQALLAGLQGDLCPAGQIEHLLVEKIAVNYWRLRRLVRYETGEVRKLLDDFMDKAIDEFYKRDSFSLGGRERRQPPMEYYDYGDEVSEADVETQAARVQNLSDSRIPLEADDNNLQAVYQIRVGANANAELPEGWRANALDFLNDLSPQQKGKTRKEILSREEQILVEMREVRNWNKKFDLLSRVRAIPNRHDLEKVIKYETALERSIFRNLATLREIQQNNGKRVGKKG